VSSDLRNSQHQRTERLVFSQLTHSLSRVIFSVSKSELVTAASGNPTPTYRSGNATCLLSSLSASLHRHAPAIVPEYPDHAEKR